jgi:hypothetical protein
MRSRSYLLLALVFAGSLPGCSSPLGTASEPSARAGTTYEPPASNAGSGGANAGAPQVLSSAGQSTVAPGTAGPGATSPSPGGGAGGSFSGSAGAPSTLPQGGAYVATGPVDFGPNVLVFDPAMGDSAIQAQLNSVFAKQETNQFGADRYAYFFKPGNYNLDVNVGFYTEVVGLGASPDDVSITGAVRSMAKWMQGNATDNFWRFASNFAVHPTAAINVNDVWAVSQATALRRVHVFGGLNLFDPEGGPNEWASGGFIADSQIDGTVVSGSQQQFLTRNIGMQQWVGGVWNMVFVGNQGNPTGTWPTAPYTFVDATPSVREKPYLTIDASGKYSLLTPAFGHATQGVSWSGNSSAPSKISLDQCYVAHAEKDSADTLNAALRANANVLFTPGVYHLTSALQVSRPGTVLFGLGLTTLIPDRGTSAIEVADVDGVTIAGILFDAGAQESPTLLHVGSGVSSTSHSANPTALFDVSCRVGGVTVGLATTCVIIDSNDVLIDNAWLWRADHGNGVGWDVNRAKHGLIVNGANVSAYGLFVEHFEEYQTMWNGENGRIYFYQSEIPYDVPSQAAWTHDGINGYSSLKIADTVHSFDGRGLGIYCFFDNDVALDNAIESPSSTQVTFQHVTTQWFTNAQGSSINHILNGTGDAVNATHNGATL